MSDDKKFLDPNAIRDPVTADELFPVDEAGPLDSPLTQSASSPGPCPDCARNAQLAMYVGVVMGVSLGALAAWVILKNRLAPVVS